MEKLYIVVRADLPPGAQVAQSCHAMRLFAAEHPEIDAKWYETSNNLVCLQVPGQEALEELARKAAAGSVEASLFHEPDYGDEPTALAVGPSGRRLVSSLALTLRAQKAA